MIEIKNLSKKYKGEEVLNNVNLTFPDNGFVFILGRSGSGKSTILNAVGGLISYQGQIFYDNNPVNIDEYRTKNIGYIFQDFLLFDDLSIYENFKIALNIIGIYDEKEIQERTSLLLQAVGLKVNIRRRASALSLGQRQRVAIARTLASNPKVILADEPTGNLDTKNSLIIMDILKRLSVNHLVICVTHNVNLVNKYADKALLLTNKQFSDYKVDGTNSSQESINSFEIGEMEVKDYQDKNLVVKLYQTKKEDNSPLEEIKIIRKDGKILVVGNNLELVKPEDVEFINNDKKEVKEEKEVKEYEAINLDFDNSKVEGKEKWKFKDSAFYSLLTFKLPSKTKSHWKNIASLFEFVIPCILLILIDSIGITRSTSIPSEEDKGKIGGSNLVALVNNDNSISSLSYENYHLFMDDEESGLIVDPFQLNFNRSGGYSSEISTKSFNFSNFTLFNQVDNYQQAQYFSLSKPQFGDIDVCKKLNGFNVLNNFELNEGEIIVDRGYFRSEKQDYGTILKVGGEDFFSKLAGTKIKISKPSLSALSEFKTYTIKDVVDLKGTMFYAKKTTADEINANYNLCDTYPYAMPNMNDYLITDYAKAMTNPDFSVNYVSNSQIGSGIKVFTSPNAKADLNGFSNFKFNILKDSSITYLPDPSKKVFCLVDSKDLTYVSGTILSCALYDNLKLYSNDVTLLEGKNPNLGNEELPLIVVPSKYKDIGLKVGSQGTNYEIAGFYTSSNYNDKIYINNKGMEFLTSYVQSYKKEVDVFAELYYSQTIESWIISNNQFFVTEDANKTKEYFKNHEEYKLNTYTYDDCFYVCRVKPAIDSINSLTTAIGVLCVVFLAISVIDSSAQVNKSKYKYGVERCLGKRKKDIVLSSLITKAQTDLVSMIIPLLFIYLFLHVCYLDYIGFGIFAIFILAYFALDLICTLVPILILLSKKPYDIIKTLS